MQPTPYSSVNPKHQPDWNPSRIVSQAAPTGSTKRIPYRASSTIDKAANVILRYRYESNPVH